MRNYHKSSLSPRCTFKIDLKKAFDSVHWNYLENLLIAVQFPSQFVQWIYNCISSAHFSVNINGSLCGWFPGKKGIRQGDRLSPYLFVLAMEVLSCLFNTAASQGVLPLHPKCKKLGLTHLCFADYLLVFADGFLMPCEQLQVFWVIFIFFLVYLLTHPRVKFSSLEYLLSKTLLCNKFLGSVLENCQ